MLNFVICDDNVNILDRLEKFLENIFVKNNLKGQVTFKVNTFEDLLKCFDNENQIDVLLLDINLKSQKTGLDL